MLCSNCNQQAACQSPENCEKKEEDDPVDNPDFDRTVWFEFSYRRFRKGSRWNPSDFQPTEWELFLKYG